MILLAILAQGAELPPADWSSLLPLPYISAPEITSPLTQFVGEEIAAGRCPVPREANGHYIVKLDIAAQMAAGGTVRRVVPRAINCPTVEQYGAGLVTSFVRANLRPTGTDLWYRTTLVFDWTG